MTKFSSNTIESSILITKKFIQTITSRLNTEQPNEYTNVYKRTVEVYKKLIDHQDRFTHEELIKYTNQIQLINTIHDPKKQKELRDASCARLIKTLDEIETRIPNIEPPKFIDLGMNKTNVIIAAHESKEEVPKTKEQELEELQKQIYTKIDYLKQTFMVVPIRLIFTNRDIHKTGYCSRAIDREDLQNRIKIAKNYLTKIAELYHKIQKIYEQLIEYLQKYYSKDVTKEDLITANNLIERILNTVKAINKSYYTITTKTEMMRAYNNAISSTLNSEEYFNKIFEEDQKIILS